MRLIINHVVDEMNRTLLTITNTTSDAKTTESSSSIHWLSSLVDERYKRDTSYVGDRHVIDNEAAIEGATILASVVRWNRSHRDTMVEELIALYALLSFVAFACELL